MKGFQTTYSWQLFACSLEIVMITIGWCDDLKASREQSGQFDTPQWSVIGNFTLCSRRLSVGVCSAYIFGHLGPIGITRLIPTTTRQPLYMHIRSHTRNPVNQHPSRPLIHLPSHFTNGFSWLLIIEQPSSADSTPEHEDDSLLPVASHRARFLRLKFKTLFSFKCFVQFSFSKARNRIRSSVLSLMTDPAARYESIFLLCSEGGRKNHLDV